MSEQETTKPVEPEQVKKPETKTEAVSTNNIDKLERLKQKRHEAYERSKAKHNVPKKPKSEAMPEQSETKPETKPKSKEPSHKPDKFQDAYAYAMLTVTLALSAIIVYIFFIKPKMAGNQDD